MVSFYLLRQVYVIRFAGSLRAGSGRNWFGSGSVLCVQWKTPDDGKRNCAKHVEFYSKNKFEKLMHLVGFIIKIYHDARSHERQNNNTKFLRTCDNCCADVIGLSRKASIYCVRSLHRSFRLSVRPPACPRVSAQFLLDKLCEIWFWTILLKPVKKIQVRLFSNKNVGPSIWRPKYVSLLSVTSVRHKSMFYKHTHTHTHKTLCCLSMKMFSMPVLSTEQCRTTTLKDKTLLTFYGNIFNIYAVGHKVY